MLIEKLDAFQSAISISASDVADLYRLLECRNRVVPLGWRVFVRHKTSKAQIGDGLHDEAVIQLVGVVDLVASRIAAGVEVTNPLEVIANVANDVAVHDLGV